MERQIKGSTSRSLKGENIESATGDPPIKRQKWKPWARQIKKEKKKHKWRTTESGAWGNRGKKIGL